MEKALISYRVDCRYLTLKLTDKDKQRIVQVCEGYGVKFLYLMQALLLKQLDTIDKDLDWLYGLLEEDRLTEKVFEGESPIEQRRAAISYANSLNEVIDEAEAYIPSIHFHQIEQKYGPNIALKHYSDQERLRLHNVSVLMLHAGAPTLIGSQFGTAEMMAAQAAEYFLYQFYGYDMGGEPVKRKVPGTALDMWYLPEGKR